jgi:predicted ester cyclase
VESTRFGKAAKALVREMPRRSALRRLGGGLAASLALGAASGRALAQDQATPTADATAATARAAISAINAMLASGDASSVEAVFSPTYVNHTPRRSSKSGQLFSGDRAGLEASIQELHGAVPDAVLGIEDVIAADDRAAVRVIFGGTIDGKALGIPALDGRVLSIGGGAFLRVANGQVEESWEYDEAAEQLGGALAELGQQAETTVTGQGETRQIENVQEVSLEGIGTLQITQGDTESLTIEAEPKVLKKIDTEVKNGRLTIKPSGSFHTREPITYHLTIKELSAIDLSGAGKVEARELESDALEIGVDGAGSVTIDKLTANTLDVKAVGKGTIELAGTVDTQTVSLSGAAGYRAGDLASRVTTITVDGAAQATIQVSDSLDVRVSGAGSVTYSGDPKVKQNVSGAGRVSKAG